jgi:hypothetical protein
MAEAAQTTRSNSSSSANIVNPPDLMMSSFQTLKSLSIPRGHEPPVQQNPENSNLNWTVFALPSPIQGWCPRKPRGENARLVLNLHDHLLRRG